MTEGIITPEIEHLLHEQDMIHESHMLPEFPLPLNPKPRGSSHVFGWRTRQNQPTEH